MNRLLKTLTIIGLLAVTAHRLPAPISEEKPSPTPEMEKLKTPAANRKSTESSDSNSARRFDGTWKATLVEKPYGAVYTWSGILIIRDGKTADVTIELTCILHDPRGWGPLPEAFKHLSPLYIKATNHSDHLVANGFDLLIRWSGGRVIDWAPKTLPLEEAQKLVEFQISNKPTALTLKGDELVAGKAVYHRVK